MPSTRDLLGPHTKAVSRRVSSFVGSLDMLGPTLEYELDGWDPDGDGEGILGFRSPHRIEEGEPSVEYDESWGL